MLITGGTRAMIAASTLQAVEQACATTLSFME